MAERHEIERREGDRLHTMSAVPGAHYFRIVDAQDDRPVVTTFTPRKLMVQAFGEEAVSRFEHGRPPNIAPLLEGMSPSGKDEPA